MRGCIIGIDPGVKSGLAIVRDGKVIWLGTVTIWDLFDALNKTTTTDLVVMEDARKRRWFGKDSAAKREGAGWIKTLCGQIEAFMIKENIDYRLIHPIKGGTKLKAALVEQISGYKGQTNEHERDAIMIALSQVNKP